MISDDKKLKTKEQLNDWLNYELKRYRVKSKLLLNFIHFSEKSLLAYHNMLLRKTEYYVNNNKKILALLYKIKLRKFQNKYSVHIPLNCCERGLRLFHLGPILINQNAVVGKDCLFHFNSALVNRGTERKAPVLGDGVMMGIGAVAMGDIYIANNVVVGANAVVNKDVTEENIAVAGVPAKKVSDNGSYKCINAK